MENKADYSYWQNALKGIQTPIYADYPQLGFYKKRNFKNGPFVPVAIFYQDEELTCLVAGKKADPYAVWTYCASHAVSEAEYRYYEANGSWASDIPVAEMGHNNPPDGFESLKDEISFHCAEIEKWLKEIKEIKDQSIADKAANWKDKLAELFKKAESARVEEKEPHLVAGKDIDAKYGGLKTTITNVGNILKDKLTSYLKEQDRIAREKAEAEMKKAREEALLKAKEEADLKGDAVPEVVFVPQPVVTTVKINAGGARGKKTSLRTYYVATIEDYSKVLEYFKDHSAVKEAIQKLCDKAASNDKLDCKIPGLKVTEDKKAV